MLLSQLVLLVSYSGSIWLSIWMYLAYWGKEIDKSPELSSNTVKTLSETFVSNCSPHLLSVLLPFQRQTCVFLLSYFTGDGSTQFSQIDSGELSWKY